MGAAPIEKTGAGAGAAMGDTPVPSRGGNGSVAEGLVVGASQTGCTEASDGDATRSVATGGGESAGRTRASGEGTASTVGVTGASSSTGQAIT